MIRNLAQIIRLLDRRARWQVALLWLLSLLVPVLDALGIGLIFPFIKVITEPGWAEQVPVMSTILAHLGPMDHRRQVIGFGSGLIALFVFKNIYFMAFYAIQHWVVGDGTARYSTNLLANYLGAPYAMHLTRNSAEMARNARELPQYLFMGVQAAIILASEILVVVLLAGLLMVTEPLATGLAVLILGGITGTFYFIARQALRRWGQVRLDLDNDTQLSLQQALMGIKDCRVLGCESYFIDSFSRRIRDYSVLLRRVRVVGQIPRQAVELAIMTSLVGVVLFMALQGGGGGDLLSKLAVFATGAFRMLPSLNRITQALGDMEVTAASLGALERDMAPPPPRLSLPAPGRLHLRESLVLEDLSFTYPESSDPAVKHIHMEIRKGETVGLVGPSGSGKSTVVDIILGLLTPCDGAILVDRTPLHDYGSWQGLVGYVPQSIYITDDTLRRNIAFGVEDGMIDDGRVWRALSMAHLDEVVAAMPGGLDTRLAEDGVRLSGGQRQRVGIARALYHDPDLLILDEATSALDPITEREISAAVEALQGSKTVIIIAHRLSTVRHCDRLFLMSDGRIADSGRFDELLERNAEFQSLVRALSVEPAADTRSPSELSS